LRHLTLPVTKPAKAVALLREEVASLLSAKAATLLREEVASLLSAKAAALLREEVASLLPIVPRLIS